MNLGGRVFFICGLSGAGKSTAFKAFEDIGVYGIDNLPVKLLEQFVQFVEPESSYALLVDLSVAGSRDSLKKTFEALSEQGLIAHLLFFDAQDEVILRRFQETRRPHPLLLNKAKGRTLKEALEEERKLLNDFREIAERVFDTSYLSPHELRREIETFFNFDNQVSVQLESFGFKYGMPRNADLLFDVRFLPNPHFVPELREKTGQEKEVAEYVVSSGEAAEFLEMLQGMLEFLLPRYEKEGKRYLNLALGCTGGKHRSVALVERVKSFLEVGGYEVNLRHRDKEGRG